MIDNRITRVALVGAGGHVGSHITRALLNTGQHQVTALTRTDSKSDLPEGLIIKHISYSDPATIVSALQNQDALVITLSGRAPAETQATLIQAAVSTGVPWILPNEWCPDLSDKRLLADVPWFAKIPETRELIRDLGRSSYISFATGFWYEWMLAMPAAYGFDFANRSVTLFGDGKQRISYSTWPQVGRAVAALLSLPVEAEAGNGTRCLRALENRAVCVQSFCVSQREMLESAVRVTGTKQADWTVNTESSQMRFKTGFEALKNGNYAEAAKVSARVFYPDGCGNFEDKTINKLLGLQTEDLDEATKVAIDRSANPHQ